MIISNSFQSLNLKSGAAGEVEHVCPDKAQHGRFGS